MGRLRYVIAFAFCVTVISCVGHQSTPVAQPTALPNQAEIVMGVDFNGT